MRDSGVKSYDCYICSKHSIAGQLCSMEAYAISSLNRSCC